MPTDTLRRQRSWPTVLGVASNQCRHAATRAVTASAGRQQDFRQVVTQPDEPASYPLAEFARFPRTGR